MSLQSEHPTHSSLLPHSARAGPSMRLERLYVSAAAGLAPHDYLRAFSPPYHVWLFIPLKFGFMSNSFLKSHLEVENEDFLLQDFEVCVGDAKVVRRKVAWNCSTGSPWIIWREWGCWGEVLKRNSIISISTSYVATPKTRRVQFQLRHCGRKRVYSLFTYTFLLIHKA